MSKEAFQDLLLLMDSELEEVRSKEREREKTTEAVVAVEVEGEEDVGDEKRPHCPTGRVHISKSNLNDNQDDNGDRSAAGSDGIPVPDPTRSFFQLPDPSRPEN